MATRRCDPKTCPKVDVRTVLRATVIARIYREFMEGQSVRDLARRYGLSGDGICRAIRASVRRG